MQRNSRRLKWTCNTAVRTPGFCFSVKADKHVWSRYRCENQSEEINDSRMELRLVCVCVGGGGSL